MVEKILFNDYCAKKEKCKMHPIDILQTPSTLPFFTNIYDPKINLIYEKNAIIDNNFFVYLKNKYIISDFGYRERIPSSMIESINLPLCEDQTFLMGGGCKLLSFSVELVAKIIYI